MNKSTLLAALLAAAALTACSKQEPAPAPRPRRNRCPGSGPGCFGNGFGSRR
jgi:nitrous oxide reductase accessory protein NosL